jgi:hypothetical protein
MTPALLLDAPIVPGRTLGGIELGRNIGEYNELLRTEHMASGQEPTTNLWGFEARFTFAPLAEEAEAEEEYFDQIAQATANRALEGTGKAAERPPFRDPPEPGEDAVQVTVDARDGMIVGLSALSGYRGLLLDAIRTGMTYTEVAARAELSWSNLVVGRVIDGVDGAWLWFERDDKVWSEEELADRKLESIEIFVPGRTDNGRIGL